MSEENKDFQPVDELDLENLSAATQVELAPSVISQIPQGVFDQLTKRNQQFMLQVDKLMDKEVFTEDLIHAIYQEMTEQLIVGQHAGQTARHIYGTPTETVASIHEQEFGNFQAEAEKSEDWQLWVDGSLMLGGLYTVLMGISALNNPNRAGISLGLSSILLNFIVAGFAMLATSKVMPGENVPKGERFKVFGKYFAVSVLSMMAWWLIISTSMIFLPPAINPNLPPIVVLVLGVLALVVRYFFKKRYNVRGGLF